MKLKIGDPAPMFAATATDDSTVKLSDYLGTKLVLYFYPMDDTPGCTRQACSLRDTNGEIAARGAAILGVSGQGVESHLRFSQKFQLSFPLLADTDRSVARAYGVAGSGIGGLVRGLFGVSERVTFLIDEAGKIAGIISAPDCPDHGQEVLRLIDALPEQQDRRV